MEVRPDTGPFLPTGGNTADPIFKIITMITRDLLTEEIKHIPERFLEELYDFVLFLKQKKEKEEDTISTHIASEQALQDWNSTEEDQAWKHL